jgi:hypothetical protein
MKVSYVRSIKRDGSSGPSFLQIVDNSQYLQKLIFNKFRANIYQFIVTIKNINIAKNC